MRYDAAEICYLTLVSMFTNSKIMQFLFKRCCNTGQILHHNKKNEGSKEAKFKAFIVSL